MIPPSARAFLVAWLKLQPEFTAIAGARAYSNRPSSKTYPLVVVDRIAGGAVPGHHQWLHDPFVQLTCEGGTNAVSAAHDLAATCSWLIGERLNGRTVAGSYECVVTGTETGGIHEKWDPVDKTLAVATLDARIYLHP